MGKKIVICGGGIIGCSIAYYLTELGETNVTVVERCDIACHSSGKAGGFLALDWNDGTDVGPLARKSFELHEILAAKIGDECGYRKVDTSSVMVKSGHMKKSEVQSSKVPSWLDGNVMTSSSIGSTKTTAQTTPAVLTKGLMSLAEKLGAEVMKGCVQGVFFKEDDTTVAGVVVDGDKIEADVVVVALGPWSKQAVEWFPRSCIPAVSACRAHSLTFRAEAVGAIPHCIFLSFVDQNRGGSEPEIYPRPNGEVYICGCSDSEPLPDDPSTIHPSLRSINNLFKVATNISSELKSAQVEKSQACYLPLSPDNKPLIGKIPFYHGAYIATGHSCWGILNGPATGLGLAEYIVKGTSKEVNLEPFDPVRFTLR